MTDLFDQQNREKELRDFDAVWPGGDALAISREFRAAYKEATGREAPDIPCAVTLTSQERNVFDLYHEGLSREKIAEKLKITSLAVKVNLSSVRRKIERASQ